MPPSPTLRARSSSITPIGPIAQGRVACKRCFIRKRKCDKLQPRCTACVEAGVECESGVKGVERNLLMQTQELQRRIDWLEGLIRDKQPALQNISSISTGSPLLPHSTRSSILQTNPQEFNLSTLVSASLSMQRAENMPDQGYVETLSPKIQHYNMDPSLSVSSASQHPQFPTIAKASEIVSRFLARHLQSHHCVTKEGIEEDLRLVYGENGLINPDFAGSRFRCFSVIYLESSPAYHGGDTSLERIYGMTCKNLALKEVSNVIAKEDLTAVQALTLLCIYGVDIPGGPSLSQLVGFAARAAMTINIHRRDDIYLASLMGLNHDQDEFKKHNELRKNIFWAIYCLDRLASFTLGQPLSIRDSDIDVDDSVPQTIDSLSVEVSSIALRCHQIHLRRLYGIVRETFYSASVDSNKTMKEKEEIVADFVRQAQALYNQSPLKAAFAPISEATISRQVVDDISYHQMIMAAHRPSPLISEIPSSFIMTLKYSASLSIDLYRHYCKSKKVLIIWTHLYQIFMSCTTLTYCFNEFHQREDLIDLDEKEVHTRIEQCKDLLSKFGTSWPESSKYQIIAIMDFWNNINNNHIGSRQNQNQIPITSIDTELQQQTFSSTNLNGEISPSARSENNELGQTQSQLVGNIDQPDVSIFDLFGNFPMLDPASTNEQEGQSASTTEQLLNSMGPPWVYKPGKVAVVLSGRQAGKKVVVIKQQDDGTKERPYPHAVVAGIERYPLKVTKNMGKKRIARRSKVKPFIKVINYAHLLPTRYQLELESLKGSVSNETFKEPTQREDAKKAIKKAFEERYAKGNNRWFFSKLRF
ncbi:hypothetical protein I203_100712 [Kwoniella mangroviensis CBS 8507]|uniref:uncharacterized protein n=1 Tax=Kwoniella mangroviensis CBS 8507 TaxID=1296122 RepID=UPI00080CD957|nr:uncharacterized protein I203_06754 [Kwoniella mangroviensis CBS 8507]OCF64170.1 hypothetical protein I203_06754 [Kwoniella mangroviensis CBS 8507]